MRRYRFLGILLIPVGLLLAPGCTSGVFSKIPETIMGKKVKREYYTNGQLRSEMVLSDNTGQNGILKKYGFDGRLTSTVPIRNGVRDGIETWYDKEGRVLMHVPYVNGRKHGVQKAYYANGDVMISTTYVKGVRHGPAIKYNKDGSIYEKVVFEHGKLIR